MIHINSTKQIWGCGGVVPRGARTTFSWYIVSTVSSVVTAFRDLMEIWRSRSQQLRYQPENPLNRIYLVKLDIQQYENFFSTGYRNLRFNQLTWPQIINGEPTDISADLIIGLCMYPYILKLFIALRKIPPIIYSTSSHCIACPDPSIASATVRRFV
jgi:hypothetical protein